MSIFNFNSSEAVDLGTAVRARSWDWLFTLQLKLGVDLHLVDRYGTTVLSSVLGGPNAVQIGRLLSSENAVRTAALTAARTLVPQPINTDDVYLTCIPVTDPRTEVGVLVVARRAAAPGQPDLRMKAELERVAEWLCTAVQAHLGSAAPDDGNHRVTALLDVMRAASSGSDRHVILTWAEAMAIWHDLDVHAYVDDMRGHFIHDAALPGANMSDVPVTIEAALLEHGTQLVPMARQDAERIGFGGAKDLAIWTLAGGNGWVIAVSGSMASQDSATLRGYIRLLEDAVSLATLTVQTRCLEAMTVQLFRDENDIHQHAEEAVKTLRDALGLSVASLTVRSSSGAPLIVVGEWQRSAASARDPGSRLVVLRHKEEQYSLALGVVKADEHHITPQDARVIDKAADLLELWAQRLLYHGKATLERRAVPRRFDMFVEELAVQASERRVPVAGMVIELRPQTFATTVAHECVARLRDRMRACDLVGVLSETDIGLLLHNTSGEDAPVVEARVRQIVREFDAMLGPDGVAIGLATRMPGDTPTQPILAEARARVVRSLADGTTP